MDATSEQIGNLVSEKLPPISFKREFIRFAAIIATIVSTVGPAIWLGADNHWLHPEEFQKHVQEDLKKEADFARFKVENQRNLYWLRLSIMDDQLTYLREKKHTYPKLWTGLDEAHLEKMERDYSNLYSMWLTDPTALPSPNETPRNSK